MILPLGSDNKRYISVLMADQNAEISYIVAADPNITPGIYPLDITTTFIDLNGTKTQTSQMGLIVGGTTDFEISAETLSTGQLSISIANIGSNNAGAVVVRIPRQQGITVSGSNTSILGNLNKGDFTLASFQIQQTGLDQNLSTTGANFRQRQLAQDQNQDSNPLAGFGNSQSTRDQNQSNMALAGAGNASALLIEIDYTDTTGERQSVQKTVQLSGSASGTLASAYASRTEQRNSELSVISWVLLAVIAGGAIIINKFKAKKAWKILAIIIALIAALFLVVIFLLNSNYLAVILAAIVSVALVAWFFRKELIAFAAKAKAEKKK